jgi:formylmethanofuran dehydrogenase subunit E
MEAKMAYTVRVKNRWGSFIPTGTPEIEYRTFAAAETAQAAHEAGMAKFVVGQIVIYNTVIEPVEYRTEQLLRCSVCGETSPSRFTTYPVAMCMCDDCG